MPKISFCISLNTAGYLIVVLQLMGTLTWCFKLISNFTDMILDDDWDYEGEKEGRYFNRISMLLNMYYIPQILYWHSCYL